MDKDEMDSPFTFGEWLKFHRKELDLTQADLAKRAGCSVPALRKIEADQRRPSRQLAGLLADSLEIPSEDQPSFIKAARGERTTERLQALTAKNNSEHSFEQIPLQSRIDLPLQPTPLIGRETEMAALGKLLVDPDCRLLTITGMGGIGKTRLAIEVAYKQQAQFPDGIYFVPLESLDSSDFIGPTIADVLKISLANTLDLQEQLINHLAVRARQSLLLVLDNLEHLLVQPDRQDGRDESALLLVDLLQNLPGLKILATSRQRINIRGEWAFELQGLPTPCDDQKGRLEDYSAVAFFIQCAKRLKADFEVFPHEQASLVKICQLVEGTPLAIQLAAAWVGVLSIDEIAQEISTNLDFLNTSMRDVPDRHRSLKATFDHSWKLLSEEERLGLSRLAVFRGGFQREAAEYVAGTSLPVLMSLFSKSLLVRKENGRYDLHEVVRQYSLSYLKIDPHYQATIERHCQFFSELVREQEGALRGAAQENAIQVLAKELDNLRAVMSRSIEQGNSDCWSRVATGLGQFWIIRGYWREGLDWLQQGLDNGMPLPDEMRAKTLTLAGWLNRYLGNLPRAISLLQESLKLCRQIGNQTYLPLTLCNLGAALFRRGEIASATELLQEALDLSEQEDDRFVRYFSLEILGHAASRQGNSQRSIDYYNQSLILAKQAGDENQITKLLVFIGEEYANLGNYDQAEYWFNMAEPICQRLGNRIIEAYVHENRGTIAMKKGNYLRAFDLLADSIFVLRELGDKEEVILCFEPMAFIVKELGYPEKAARLLSASETLRKAMGVTHSNPAQANFEMYHASVLRQLGQDVFETAFLEGSRMTYDQAIEYAVDQSWRA